MFTTRSNRKFCSLAQVLLPKILQFGFHFLQRTVEEFTKNKIPSEEEAWSQRSGPCECPFPNPVSNKTLQEEEPGKNKNML